MIKWEGNEEEMDQKEVEFAKVEAYRAIAEQLEKFVNFIKIASVGGMCLTIVYFILKIIKVF